MKRILFRIVFLLLLQLLPLGKVEAGTIYNSPYVSITEDGEAWTTCPGEGHNYGYREGYTVSTGQGSTLEALKPGEHYYNYVRHDPVPVARWEVAHPAAACVHDDYPAGEFHGISYNKQNCEESYTQGWLAYCADCGAEVVHMYIYMCGDAAKSIRYLPVGMDYYYICPHCSNLEQGNKIPTHTCKRASWNRYKVIYDANTNGLYSGVMQPGFYMYNNATVYEGEQVVPNTRLSKVAFKREGYEFVGWNTKADGSGIGYADGSEILNLTTENYTGDKGAGCVYLYAQWRLSRSVLEIDPAGGTYRGKSGITRVEQFYLSRYDLDEDVLLPPTGPVLSFASNGGGNITPITVSYRFAGWIPEIPLRGNFSEGSYYFTAPGGSVDRVTARYLPDTIRLPGVNKSNASFGGWYYDAECSRPAGSAGDEILIEENTTLYAQWVDLKLTSKENYVDNSGCGAVDLSWSQSDKNGKAYKLYLYEATNANRVPGESVDDWTRINTVSDIGNVLQTSAEFGFSGGTKTYTIPYSGIYTLTAGGAQGGNNNSGSYQGGLGGEVSGKFWFSAGDMLTIDVGGQNGYGGGGMGDSYGIGGGRTIVTSARYGTVLVAGGGGGATIKGDGGPGGGSTGLRKDGNSSGENGGAGGGAGYVGGTAGELIVHRHSENCYYTEAMDYTLFDSDGVDAWMNQYWNGGTMHSEFDGSYWGKTVYRDGNTIVLQSHNGGEEDINYLSHRLLLGMYENREKPSWAGTYIPVKGNKNAEIILKVYAWGEDADVSHYGSYLRVYNQDGNCIYGKALIPYTTQTYTVQINDTQAEHVPKALEENINGIPGLHRNYKQSYAWEDDDGNWWGCPVSDTTSGIITVPLPEGTSEIYIELYTEVDLYRNANVQHQTAVSAVRFTGGIKKQLICGYSDGQVISSKPGYGGSNYVNTSICGQYTDTAGSRRGDGYLTIKSLELGYVETLNMTGIPAPDKAAPDKIPEDSIRLRPVSGSGGKKVDISWSAPQDNGTEYYFRAESYLARTGAKLCDSNVTHHILTTGIKGYRYLVDIVPGTVVNTGNSIYTTFENVQVILNEKVQYLHVAAVDVAGNLSGTTSVKLGSSHSPAEIRWPVFTERIEVAEGDGIYPASGTNAFYVRCDGNTPIELSFGAYMEGAATEKYQITHTIFESEAGSGATARNVIETPATPIHAGNIIASGNGLYYGAEGTGLLQFYFNTRTIRSNYNRDLQVISPFVISPAAAGKVVRVTPRAAVRTEDGFVYSDSVRDVGNSIYLIGDCEAPIITGTEMLEQNQVIDREAGKVHLTLKATDSLSGLAQFRVHVYNEDNGTGKTYTADGDGGIALDITGESPLYAGDFTITMTAVDHVGNRVEKIYHMTEFALETKLERILAPHEPAFQRGESGRLTIETWGHVDRLEVQFPDALSRYSTVFNYDYPRYKTVETIQFMVPLDVEADGMYEIEIRAYKNQNQLVDARVFTISGTVLDDLRSRLR